MLGWIKNLFATPLSSSVEKDLQRSAVSGAAQTTQDEAGAVCKHDGDAHLDNGDWLHAADSYRRALSSNPALAEAHSNLGFALMKLGSFAEAKSHLQCALSIKPHLFNAFYILGLVSHYSGDLAGAISSIDQANTIKPDFQDGFIALGNALCAAKRFDEALASYDHALALDPHDPTANWGKSLVALASGDFIQGWQLYEWRWLEFAKSMARQYRQPKWLGEASVAGKTILIYPEQGFGDVIQFCRYAPLVEKLGARVIFEAPQQILGLLSTLEGDIRIVELGKPLPEFDLHCPVMSLPLAFKTSMETIPASVPYLFSAPDKRAAWNERLGQKRQLRVGLVWSGGFRGDQPETWSVNARRNIALSSFASLNLPGIEFFSLQKGEEAQAQLRQLEGAFWNGPAIADYTAEFHDFSDTAAFIDNLDIIISVDTAIAHLAGAMGKEVWILNRFDNCWRWMADRSDSPWYPTATLFRQKSMGDWDSVMLDVKRRLGSEQK